MAKKKDILDFQPNESKRAFRSCFDQLARTQDYSTVFGDFVEFALLMMNINKTEEDFKELERRWTKPEEHLLFAQMFNHWTNSIEPYEDLLGDLFMECVSHGRNGQFFTPSPICEMMAKMQMHEITLKPDMKILDPACGSGRTILAGAKIYRELPGFTPEYDMNYYAGDNDGLCAKMTALNFIINTMAGEVWHMDALSLEHYRTYHIKKILNGTHYIPYYFITGPGTGSWRTAIQVDEEKNEPVTSENTDTMTIPEPKVSKHGQLTFF
jgi:type I restriction-modification system DNA methylase subunit